MHLDPSQLAAFSAILRHGSFDAAARELNVTPSAISQRVKALENRVGTPLVIRGTPCTATPVGHRLARHAQDLSLLQAQLDQDLGWESGPTRVKIAVNADSLATWFIAALTGHDTLFELEVDDQDHSTTWLRNGAVAAAVTSRETPVQGCACYPLGALKYVPTASPEFVAKWFPDGVTHSALRAAPVMTFDTKDQLQVSWMRSLTGKELHPPSHVLPSTQAFVDGACAGLGWGMNPLPLIAEHLRDGRLVPLIEGATLSTPLFWQVARHVQEPLSAVTKAVRRAAKSALDAPDTAS